MSAERYPLVISDVTQIIERLQRGDPQAADQLLPLVYDELRKLAAQRMSHEAPGQTLQPTALVHEVWLRLAGARDSHWDGRSHFFAAAAEAMRRILIDNARRKRAARHGSGQPHLDINEVEIAVATKDDEILAIDEALAKFALQDKPTADLVKLRYFAGLTLEQAAEVLGISLAMAKRHWTFARAWLLREILKSK